MKTEYLRIRIDPITKERARVISESEGKKLSEWVTDLLKYEIRRRSIEKA